MNLLDALKEIWDDSSKYAINTKLAYGIRYDAIKNDMVNCNKLSGVYTEGSCSLYWNYVELSEDGWEIKTVVRPKYKIGDRFLLNDLSLQKTEKGQTYSIVKSENVIGQIITWASDANGNVIYTVSTGGITFPLILTEEYLEKLDMVVSQK